MGSTAPPLVARAFFCPQCGQAIRPEGARCAECGALIALPPGLYRLLQSEAEALVPLVGRGMAATRFLVPSVLHSAGASIIDAALILALLFPALLILGPQVEAIPLLALALALVWQVAFPPLLCGTPGMRMMGLYLINADTEAAPDPIRALLRALGLVLLPLSGGIATLAILGHPERVGWHDQLAGTRLVAPRPALP